VVVKLWVTKLRGVAKVVVYGRLNILYKIKIYSSSRKFGYEKCKVGYFYERGADNHRNVVCLKEGGQRIEFA
jgi:hypothetical protein